MATGNRIGPKLSEPLSAWRWKPGMEGWAECGQIVFNLSRPRENPSIHSWKGRQLWGLLIQADCHLKLGYRRVGNSQGSLSTAACCYQPSIISPELSLFPSLSATSTHVRLHRFLPHLRQCGQLCRMHSGVM